MKKYEITYKLATPYQTSGQVELTYTKVKQILENMVNPSCKDWSI